MMDAILNDKIGGVWINTGPVRRGTGWDSYRFHPLRLLQWKKEVEASWTTIKVKCD